MTSIIITTFNRPDTLDLTLNALNNQTVNKNDFEVLIIEGDQSMPSEKIVEKFSALNIQYLYEATPGVTPARHMGAKEANGGILIYLEDDGIPCEIWLESILQTFEKDENIGMVGGKNLPRYQEIPPKWIEELWTTTDEGKVLGQLTLIDMGDKDKYISTRFIWALNLAIRKDLLFKTGGFNPDLSPKKYQFYQGDGETGLSTKVEKLGYKGYYSSSAIVEHIITKDRFTEEYMYKRMYFQGIANSYSDLREHKVFTNLQKKESERIKIINKEKLKEKYSKFIKIIMHNAQIDGYIDHQNNAKNNKKILNWIIKDNYLDYNISDYQ